MREIKMENETGRVNPSVAIFRQFERGNVGLRAGLQLRIAFRKQQNEGYCEPGRFAGGRRNFHL